MVYFCFNPDKDCVQVKTAYVVGAGLGGLLFVIAVAAGLGFVAGLLVPRFKKHTYVVTIGICVTLYAVWIAYHWVRYVRFGPRQRKLKK